MKNKIINTYIFFLVMALSENMAFQNENIINISSVQSEGIEKPSNISLKSETNVSQTEFENSDDLKIETKSGAQKNEFRSPLELQPLIVPSGGNELCKKHTQIYLQDLKTLRKWAIQLWDATGKVNAGLYSGNSNSLGDFNLCLSIQGPEDFKPNYCLAEIDIDVTDSAPSIIRDLLKSIKLDDFLKANMNTPNNVFPRFSTIHWGVCVPKSCSKESIELGLINALSIFNSTTGLTVQPRLQHYSCQEYRDPFNKGTILTILFFIIVLVVAVIGTILDTYYGTEDIKNKGIFERILLAFSLKRNLSSLVSKSTDEFPFLHGFRFILSILTYFMHRCIWFTSVFFTHRSTLAKLTSSPISPLVRTAYLNTHTFLFMSGFLGSYSLTRQMATKGFIDWKKHIINRLIRLTPPLLAVTLYYAHIMEHTGSGPQWGNIVTTNADVCKRNFWETLFYIQSTKLEERCVIQTHSLATDTFLYILSLPLIYVLHEYQIFGIIFTIGGIIVSCIRTFNVTYINKWSTYNRYGVTSEELHGVENEIHLKLVNNFKSYLVGIAFGYFMQKYKKDMLVSKKLVPVGWIISTIAITWCVFSQRYLDFPDHVFNPFDASLYSALSPVIMALSMCWIILMFSLNLGGFLQRVLSSFTTVVFSRLSYAFYLTQYFVIYYYAGSLKATNDISIFDLFDFWQFVTILTMSLILMLLFESPMQEIKNIIFEGISKKKIPIKKE